MGRNKSDILSGMGAGFEILKALKDEVDRRGGNGDECLRKIKSDKSLRNKIAELLVGNTATSEAAAPVVTVPVVHTVDLDADPYVPNGSKVEEHKKGGQFVWDKEKVKLYLSERQKGSSYLIGNDLRKELEDKPVFNANLLDFLLKHPELIPDEWKGKYVFFWGTIYRGSFGYLCVRCLCWNGRAWYWHSRWLGRKWRSSHPAVVPAS